MSQTEQVKIKIIKVIMDAKFPCTMHIERQSIAVAQSIKHEKGMFLFDTDWHTIAYKEKIVEWVVKLKTMKGAIYNCGKISINTNINSQKYKTVLYPIENCYDKNAKAELLIEFDIRNSLASFSQPKIKTMSLNYPSQPDMQLHFSSNVNDHCNNSISSVTDRIGKANDGVYSIFCKEREKKNRTVSSKANNIRRVFDGQGRQNYERQLSSHYRDNEEKQNIIESLQLQIVRLENALESMKSKIEQQKRIEIDMIYLHQEQIQFMKDECNKTNQSNCNALNQQISKLKKEIDSQQNIINNANASLNEYTRFLQSKQQKLSLMEKQSLERNTQIEVLNRTIKAEKLKSQTILLEKQQLVRKHKQNQKQTQQYLQVNKKYKLAAEQLGILKIKLKETVDIKDSIIERLGQQSKRKIQWLNSSLNAMSQQLKQLNISLSNSQNKIIQLNDTIITVQQKNKQCIHKISAVEKKYQKSKLSEQSYKRENELLKQSQKQLSQKLQQIQTQIGILKQQKQKQALECEQKQKKINILNESLNSMNYRIEQNEIQSAISVQQNNINHLNCKVKIESLAAKLQNQTLKNAKLTENLIQYKNSYEQSERLLHELRLEQSKLKQQWACKHQKLVETQRKFTASQKQIRAKQALNENLAEQVSKQTQINKENEKKIIKLSLQNFELQQKAVKIITQSELNSAKLNQMEIQLANKIGLIQKLEQKQIELIRKAGKQKEERTKTQNELRIAKRQMERYINQIKAEISLHAKVDSEKPIQGLVSYYKNAMVKMESEVSEMVQQLKQVKDEMEVKNKTIQQLQSELEVQQKESHTKSQAIDEMQYELQMKESQYQAIKQQYEDLLSVHEQYIFTFNRYKIDKEAQISSHQQQFDQIQGKLKIQLKTKCNQLESTNQHIVKLGKYKQTVAELQNKLRLLNKEVEKNKKAMSQLKSELEKQKLKSFKLANQVNVKSQQNNKLMMESQLLKNSFNEFTEEIKQKKQLLKQANLIKDRINAESIRKSEENQKLRQEKYVLQIKIQQLAHEGKDLAHQINTLHRIANEKHLQEKKSQQQLANHLQIISELTAKVKQKQQKAKQINQIIEQQRIKYSKELFVLGAAQKQLQQQNNANKIIITNLQMEKQKLIEGITQQNVQNQNMNTKIADLQKIQKKCKNLIEQLQVKQRKIKLLNQQVSKQTKNLQQCNLENRKLKEQLCQKQQSLFSISGRANSIQLNWENQQKRLKTKQLQLNQQFAIRLQQYKNNYQQKLEEAEQIIAQKQKNQKRLTQITKLNQQQIQKLKNDLREANFFTEQRSKIHQQQFQIFKRSMQQKLIKQQAIFKQNYQKQKNIYQIKKQQFQFKIQQFKNLIDKENQNSKKLNIQLQIYKQKINELQANKRDLQQKLKLKF